jgi:tol-pal system protein YbgF
MLIPAVMLTAGACFATRNDVRTLQSDIGVLRAENARSDSVHRAQFQLAAGQVGAVSDSLRSLTAFIARFTSDVSRFEGDLSINLHTFGQQLLTLQELTGQNQKRLQDMRAELERQEADLASAAQPSVAPPSGLGASSAMPAGAGAGQSAGPAQLYQTGLAMLNRGSYAAARAAFAGFLEQFPKDDLAGEAQYGIAHSFDLEGQAAAADSTYAIVVAKYPKTEHASSALYKRGMAAKQAGQAATAQKLFQQVLDSYPRSPEAAVVADLLKKP